MLANMTKDTPSSVTADVIILAGLSSPVMSHAAWLANDKFRLRHLHVVSTTQGLTALRMLAGKTGLPPCEGIFWHGEEVDGTDGAASQAQFHKIVSSLAQGRRDGITLQMILGGGVNWMISIASQIAALALREGTGDGLWILKTAPHFENHPHYLRPGDKAAAFDPDQGLVEGSGNESRLQRVLLIHAGNCLASTQTELVEFDETAIRFLGQSVTLPPLQMAFYRWLLMKTKQACRRPQLSNCEACYACALPAKNLAMLAEEFFAYYLKNSAKPGYIKHATGLDFPQRASEAISKINTHIRKKVNLASYRQLKINHTEGGYLPGVDKNRLRPD